MVVYMNEYKFAEGDKATEIYSQHDIDSLRRQFDGNCYNLAFALAKQLHDHGIIASLVTFRNGTKNGITVWSDLDNCYKTYGFHAVVLLGDCIMDLSHTDRLISTSEYVERLKGNNSKLRIDQSMTGVWYTGDGYECPVTLESLSSGVWG